MKTLSVVVLTYNNEEIIARFARSVAWADELIIVDSGSTDSTLEVAQAEHPNCRILIRPLDSFASQRNHGLDHARGEWVMHCDSDHVVPPGLRDEILEVLRQDSPPYQAYNVYQNLYWKRQLLAHASGPCGFQCMLHRRECARFSGRIHEKLRASVPVGMLREPLDHVTGQTVEDRLRQMIMYVNTEVDAIVVGERPFVTGRVRMFWRPLRRLVRDVVIRRAYRDGVPGMAWALMTGFRLFLIHFRYWQLHDTTWREYERPSTASETRAPPGHVQVHRRQAAASDGPHGALPPTERPVASTGAFSVKSSDP